MTAFQQFMNLRLFRRQQILEKPLQIIAWWEIRRVVFNFIVGLAGISTCLLVIGLDDYFSDKFGRGIGGGGSPLLPLIAVFLYAIMANIFYTAGWVSELLLKAVLKDWANHFGEIIFPLGLLFSVLVTLSPVGIYLLLLLLKIAFR